MVVPLNFGERTKILSVARLKNSQQNRRKKKNHEQRTDTGNNRRHQEREEQSLSPCYQRAVNRELGKKAEGAKQMSKITKLFDDDFLTSQREKWLKIGFQ